MTLAQMEARIVDLLREKVATHEAWFDRAPGDDASDEPLWSAYCDARRAYERALEDWFTASRDEIARLNETIERMVA